MKKLIILLLMGYVCLNAQNKDATNLPFTFSDGSYSNTHLDVNDSWFALNHILRGWHWSGDQQYDKNVNSAFGTNFSWSNRSRGNWSSQYNDSFRIVHVNQDMGNTDQSTGPFQSQSMEFDTRLEINAATTTSTNVSQQDIIHQASNNNLDGEPIFGFINPRGSISQDGKYRTFDKNTDTGYILRGNSPSLYGKLAPPIKWNIPKQAMDII